MLDLIGAAVQRGRAEGVGGGGELAWFGVQGVATEGFALILEKKVLVRWVWGWNGGCF